MAFTKLDSGIVNSTLWVHPHDVLRVWIAMLAQCNADGIVRAAAPALANLCMIPIDRMREILLLLESPDPDSRSSGDEGRRIKKIEGGWQLVNYLAYRNARDQETRREQNRESQRRHRDKVSQGQHLSASVSKVSTVSQSQPASAQAEAEGEEKRKDTQPTVESPQAAPADACPHREIIDLYHELLPSLTRVKEWTPARQAFLRKRWNEKPERQNLDWWRGFFVYVAESDFLCGRTTGAGGSAFECDLEWLVRPRNLVKVIEGKYENRGVAA